MPGWYIDFELGFLRSILFIEAGWHIKLDKLVSSSVAQIIKLIQLVNKPVPGKQTMLTYPFIFSRDWTLLQYRACHQF